MFPLLSASSSWGDRKRFPHENPGEIRGFVVLEGVGYRSLSGSFKRSS